MHTCACTCTAGRAAEMRHCVAAVSGLSCMGLTVGPILQTHCYLIEIHQRKIYSSAAPSLCFNTRPCEMTTARASGSLLTSKGRAASSHARGTASYHSLVAQRPSWHAVTQIEASRLIRVPSLMRQGIAVRTEQLNFDLRSESVVHMPHVHCKGRTMEKKVAN